MLLRQDFDRLASQRVQSMLDEVDIVMYDPAHNRPEPSQLANECRDWTTAFPHIRYSIVFSAHCSIVHSTVLRLHGLRLSVRPPTVSAAPRLGFAPHPKLQSLLSHERVKPRTTNLADTFRGSNRTKAH